MITGVSASLLHCKGTLFFIINSCVNIPFLFKLLLFIYLFISIWARDSCFSKQIIICYYYYLILYPNRARTDHWEPIRAHIWSFNRFASLFMHFLSFWPKISQAHRVLSFLVLALESASSPRSLHSFQWRIVFRSQDRSVNQT